MCVAWGSMSLKLLNIEIKYMMARSGSWASSNQTWARSLGILSCYPYLLNIIDFLSNCYNSYTKWGIEVFKYFSGIIYFFFQFCYFLLPVFWNSGVRCLYVYICFDFLESF